MSGPKTANYSLNRAILELGQAVHQYEEQERQARAAERREEQERRARIIREKQDAERKRLAQLQKANERAKSARAELEEIAQSMRDFIASHPNDTTNTEISSLPTYPDDSSDRVKLDRYAQQAEQLRQNLQSRLQQIHVNTHFRSAFAGLINFDIAAPKTAAELINALAQTSALTVQKNQLLSRKAEAEKLTQRIEMLSLAEISVELRGLLHEFLTTESDNRAEILGTEIRVQTQTLLNSVTEIQQERKEAEKYLEILMAGSDTFEESKLREQLALVAAGAVRSSPALKSQTQSAIIDLEQKQLQEAQQKDQADAADILSDVFQDLGYEIEPISHTLFAEGGTIHFRQPGWDKNYYVRMKVQPEHNSANFNMVRTEEGSTDTQVQKSQDTKMENAWCGDPAMGFKRIQKVAKDRGLVFDCFRQIQPGQLAVQVVTKDSVALAETLEKYEQTSSQTARPLRERTLP